MRYTEPRLTKDLDVKVNIVKRQSGNRLLRLWYADYGVWIMAGASTTFPQLLSILRTDRAMCPKGADNEYP
jgi:hypothetical protein